MLHQLCKQDFHLEKLLTLSDYPLATARGSEPRAAPTNQPSSPGPSSRCTSIAAVNHFFMFSMFSGVSS